MANRQARRKRRSSLEVIDSASARFALFCGANRVSHIDAEELRALARPFVNRTAV